MGKCQSVSERNDPDPLRLNVKSDVNNKNPKGVPKLLQCKVVILGDCAVGKTSIAIRYLQNKFDQDHNVTVGAQFQTLRVELKNGNTLKMSLWDTAGQEKFRSMLPMYYKDAKAAILVYDIGNAGSFKSMEYWLSALSEHIKNENIVLYLVGNKKDLHPDLKQVSKSLAQPFANENKMLFSEVSAKTGEGVHELFKDLAEELSSRFKL